MKVTKFIELFYMIKKSIVAYLSIIFFIATGIALYTGMAWGMTSFEQGLTDHYHESNFYPYTITYPFGLNEDQIQEIKEIDGIDDAEGYFISYQKISEETSTDILAVVQITERVNKITLVEGTLPQEKDEIVVGSIWADSRDVKIGDTIQLDEETDLSSQNLNTYKFIVSGIGDDCAHLSTNPEHLGVSFPDGEMLTGVLYVNEDAFNKNAFKGYPCLSVFSNSLFDYGIHSEDFNSFTQDLNDHIISKLENWHTDTENAFHTVSSAKPMVSLSVAHSLVNSFIDIVDTSNNTTSPIFLIIGILIVFSTITRSVSSSVIHIGTKKALGFSNREIRMQYLGFSFSASVCGIVFGLLLGYLVIQPFVASAIAANCTFRITDYVFDIFTPAIPIVGELAVALLITLFSCNSFLKQETTLLLSGGEVKAGKKHFYEKWTSFNKLSTFKQAIINNLFIEHKRVVNTLISIVSCSALIVLGITYAYNTNASITKQYSDYFLFDYVITFDENNADAENEIGNLLSEYGLTHIRGLRENLRSTLPDNRVNSPCLLVTDSKEELDKLFHIKFSDDQVKDKEYVYSEEFLDQYFGVGSGDSYEVTTINGQNPKLTIDNVFAEYTITHYFIMDGQAYEKYFDTDYQPNRYFINSGNCDIDLLTSRLNDIDGFKMIENQKQIAIDGYATVSGISNALAVLYIFLAVVMALMVLMNIINVCILEKQNEMRMLIINGATIKEAKQYVIFDTIIQTVFGIIIGCALGIILGNISITGLEGNAFRLIHDICPLAIVGGIVITSALSFLITIVSLRKVRL